MDPMAGSAQFYLGEIAYRQHNYDEAIKDYNAVLEQFTRQPQSPAAQLHKGLALINQSKREAGISRAALAHPAPSANSRSAAGARQAERDGRAHQPDDPLKPDNFFPQSPSRLTLPLSPTGFPQYLLHFDCLDGSGREVALRAASFDPMFQREKPRAGRGFFSHVVKVYCKFAINASSADLGGRTIDSGNVPSGSSTMFSRSMNVGFFVLM